MSGRFRLERTWRLVLRDLGVSPGNLLRRAGVPADLFARDDATVTGEEYFRLCDALAAEAGDPDIGLRIGQSLTAEMFDPAIFAALCSPDLNTAVERLARFKRLVGPFTLGVDVRDDRTVLTYGALGLPALPTPIGQLELVFLTTFARVATRSPLRPVEVVMPVLPADPAAFAAFFGIPVRLGAAWSIGFAALDARRPFLTADAPMWDFFEPALRRRLAEIEDRATTAERVRAALIELLPGGRSGLADVARALGTSTRSLQRRLGDEGTSFQAVLGATREALARHYLSSTAMQGAEIGFLLGYDDPSSFFRAFHQWTGTTPESVRAATA